MSQAYIVTKETGVLCGIEFAKRVFKRLDERMQLRFFHKDGDIIKKGAKILSMRGKTRAILAGERTALNFLIYLSRIATNTNRFVEAVRPYKTQIFSTRKTTPGLREFEKYAVRCGGGMGHRNNLGEMSMIKDNHRDGCNGKMTLFNMIKELRKKHKNLLAGVKLHRINKIAQIGVDRISIGALTHTRKSINISLEVV